MGLRVDELIPMGRQLAKVDYFKAIKRLQGKRTAKYIDVTAITPTPRHPSRLRLPWYRELCNV
ncbi:formate--tetrahydrofolate ligase [Planctomycetota bacterium]